MAMGQTDVLANLLHIPRQTKLNREVLRQATFVGPYQGEFPAFPPPSQRPIHSRDLCHEVFTWWYRPQPKVPFSSPHAWTRDPSLPCHAAISALLVGWVEGGI